MEGGLDRLLNLHNVGAQLLHRDVNRIQRFATDKVGEVRNKSVAAWEGVARVVTQKLIKQQWRLGHSFNADALIKD